VLAVGESAPISVYFSSDLLGTFSELFELRMKGCTAVLRVNFKGVVVPPSFSVDVEELAFGNVPFDFSQTRQFTITNTSDVAMAYNLHVPQDGRASESRRREFVITPARGVIPPHGQQPVAVEFTSNTAKTYNGYRVTMDVVGAGEGLLNIPLTATCVVPVVTLAAPTLVYGSCFVRYPFTQSLTLINHDPLPARFTFVPQDDHSVVVATFTPEEATGVVPAHGSVTVGVELTAYKVGPIALPMFVRVSGTTGEPLKVRGGMPPMRGMTPTSHGPLLPPSRLPPLCTLRRWRFRRWGVDHTWLPSRLRSAGEVCRACAPPPRH